MSDTPRTNDECRRRAQLRVSAWNVSADFARELERELAAVKAELAQRTVEVAKANAERDAARRMFCELLATISQTTSRPTQPLNIANWRGWNCFEKEVQP